MKKLKYKAIVIFAFSLSLLYGSKASALSEETLAKLNNPFLLPQTNFVLGNVGYSLFLSDSTSSSTSILNSGGLNTYGFDIEVNHSPFLNLGAYLRIETQSTKNLPQTVNDQFTGLLGGFGRFFYVPTFLKGKTVIANIFSRVE